VDKRIQEDNLQHLALFAEYGRLAVAPRDKQKEGKHTGAKSIGTKPLESPTKETKETEETKDANADSAATTAGADVDVDAADDAAADVASQTEAEAKAAAAAKPFQRLQFLVRDWQNFDVDWDPADQAHHQELYKDLETEMQTYLAEVLRDRGDAQSDLRTTREQIHRCFGELDCFMLPHPGTFVTKRSYDGSIENIDPFFRALLNRSVIGYVRLLHQLVSCLCVPLFRT
jgi:atlastin